MTRRIVRTGLQLGFLVFVAFFLVLFLDNRYRVLPNAIHNHLPAHHPGFVVIDVNIISCSALNPFSKCATNDEYWHKIDKDLYLGRGFPSKAYLHVRRKKEEDLETTDDLVFDVHVGQTPPPDDKPGKNEKWESRSMGLWIKRSSKRHLSDSTRAVTGVDVLFGPDAADPRSNWEIQEKYLAIDARGEHPEPRLTVRKGPSIKVNPPVPRIRKDGKFKILQASDLHLATGYGKCRDAVPDEYEGGPCRADPRTLAFVERILVEEKPDLIILSGDQVNGDTSPDAQSGIYKYSALFAKHQIPYAGIFGNHDDESNLNRAQSMAIMDGLPYSLSTAGPSDIEGVGNYYIEILGRGSTHASALTIYMLDTHSYSPEEKKYHGYDWLKQSQIEWFKTTSQHLKRKHKDYTHIHMDLAFIHIPLPEYRNPDGNQWIGNWSEASTAPAYNSNFKDALVEENVLLVSCGHDHVNDYCLPANDKDGKAALWMCYGGGAGFGGYGGYGGYIRRMRLFEFDMNEARIRTWKRLEWGSADDLEKRIDEQIIVDGGKVITGM
ncbi:Phosphatase dcr2 [Neophaeococcomyces mojaviensis]|uniref:Phosphatase dcr2 n=1 Tax=Neophaeococcomyces mojaviensis TaxID=3383035 RepID=A0ACC3AEX9_9EURO|nr:Phosphatase dcr2 [Knufia sp. JES_112]